MAMKKLAAAIERKQQKHSPSTLTSAQLEDVQDSLLAELYDRDEGFAWSPEDKPPVKVKHYLDGIEIEYRMGQKPKMLDELITDLNKAGRTRGMVFHSSSNCGFDHIYIQGSIGNLVETFNAVLSDQNRIKVLPGRGHWGLPGGPVRSGAGAENPTAG